MHIKMKEMERGVNLCTKLDLLSDIEIFFYKDVHLDW